MSINVYLSNSISKSETKVKNNMQFRFNVITKKSLKDDLEKAAYYTSFFER